MADDEETFTPEIINKLQKSGIIATRVLDQVIAKAVPGADIQTLTRWADAQILRETGAIYKKVVCKGVAHPTIISVNDNINGVSAGALAKGMLAKIYLAVHIDGFTAHACRSIIVGATESTPVPEIINAVQVAGEAIARVIKPGVNSLTVTRILEYIAASSGVKLIKWVSSHQSHQWVLRGIEFFPGENFEFELGQTYNIDVVFSEGSGDTKDIDPAEFPVYYRTDRVYHLKTRAGRQVLSDIEKRYFTLPFDGTQFASATEKFGLQDCIKNEVVDSYEAYRERSGENTARYSFTILITDNGILKTTGLKRVDLSTVGNTNIKHILAHPLKTLEPIELFDLTPVSHNRV